MAPRRQRSAAAAATPRRTYKRRAVVAPIPAIIPVLAQVVPLSSNDTNSVSAFARHFATDNIDMPDAVNSMDIMNHSAQLTNTTARIRAANERVEEREEKRQLDTDSSSDDEIHQGGIRDEDSDRDELPSDSSSDDDVPVVNRANAQQPQQARQLLRRSMPVTHGQRRLTFSGQLRSPIKAVQERKQSKPLHIVDRRRSTYSRWLADPTKFRIIRSALREFKFRWKLSRDVLIERYPQLDFDALAVTTMRYWFVFDEMKNTYRTRKSIKNRLKHVEQKPFGGGRASLMKRADKAVKLAIKTVDALRAANMPVNSANALPIITAIFQLHAKSVYQSLNINQRFIRRFLQQYCGMSYRRVTACSKSLPHDASEQVDRFVKRCASLVHLFQIKPELVVNLDQSGSRLTPSASYTYAQVGSKRATVQTHDDKRQITIVVGSTLSGLLLPLQFIFGGKTQQCLPLDERLGPETVKQIKSEGHDLTFTENHWSSLGTMIEYVDRVSSMSNAFTLCFV